MNTHPLTPETPKITGAEKMIHRPHLRDGETPSELRQRSQFAENKGGDSIPFQGIQLNQAGAVPIYLLKASQKLRRFFCAYIGQDYPCQKWCTSDKIPMLHRFHKKNWCTLSYQLQLISRRYKKYPYKIGVFLTPPVLQGDVIMWWAISTDYLSVTGCLVFGAEYSCHTCYLRSRSK